MAVVLTGMMVRSMVMALTRVVMVAVVIVGVAVIAPSGPAPKQQDIAEEGNGQPRTDGQPGVQPLGHDVAGGVERHATEEVHPGSVRRGHDHTQKEGVARRTP